jgi:hypothetical protein
MKKTIAAPPEEKPKDDPTIWEVDDALWAQLQPLLVITKPRKKSGRPRSDDRPIFNGLIWLARNGGQARNYVIVNSACAAPPPLLASRCCGLVHNQETCSVSIR